MSYTIEDAVEQCPECAVYTRIITPCFNQQAFAYLPKSGDFLAPSSEQTRWGVSLTGKIRNEKIWILKSSTSGEQSTMISFYRWAATTLA